MNKTMAERVHAKKRAFERYNIEIGRKGLQEIVSLIQTGKTKLLRRQSNRVSVHRVVYRNSPLKVVYDRERKNIITFLPFD